MHGRVRTAQPGDAASIANIYAPFVRDTFISFEQAPPSPSEIEQRMASALAAYPYLVFEGAEGVLGYAQAGPHRERPAYRWSVDVTAYVAGHAHGRGIGRALYRDLLAILTRQGFHAAFAGIALPNAKSVGLHEAMGFVHLGTYQEVGFKHGAWRDVGWWRRPLADGDPPADPTPFSALA